LREYAGGFSEQQDVDTELPTLEVEKVITPAEHEDAVAEHGDGEREHAGAEAYREPR
jgi:hypothetical protein